MPTSKILHQRAVESGELTIKQEERNNRTCGKFRHLSREVSGEVFEVPDDNVVVFAYLQRSYAQTIQVGQACFSLAELSMKEPGTNFDSEHYSQIAFLFIHRDFQCRGFGSLIMHEVLKCMRSHETSRPVRLQSAEEAVPFFERLGFVVKGSPIQCFHSGSHMFRTIINMELVLE